MTTIAVLALLSVILALVVGWLVPAWVMRRLVPTLEASSSAANYRGHPVALGLGAVWLVWAIALLGASTLVNAVLSCTSVLYGENAPAWLPQLNITPLGTALGLAPLLLVVGAFGFGLLDDLFGGGEARGFGGHLRELAHGRMTTGALKMLGIGGLALYYGLFTASNVSRASEPGGTTFVLFLAAWVCAALLIALTANFVNLTDLRPGRALKSYSGLAVLAIVAAAFHVWPTALQTAERSLPAAAVFAGAAVACLALLLLGPVFAVWRYDLGERAMLGDAGANAMGALVGFVIAASVPVWLLAVATVVMLALNLTSERVSFSRVIEQTAFLRRLDRIGRLDDGSGDAGGTDCGMTGGGTDEPACGTMEARDRRDGGS